MTDANGQHCTNRPTGRLPEGAWTHLVVVVDRAHAETRYYFNGQLDSAQKIPPTFAGPLDVDYLRYLEGKLESSDDLPEQLSLWNPHAS